MLFRLGPPLTLAMLILPVLAGLAGTLLPAFGYFPALGGTELTLAPWRELFGEPWLPRSLGVSLFVGFAATLLSLAAVALLTAGFMGRRGFTLLRRALSPLLAVPHVAMAFGLAFAIAPSGLVFRLLSPWATGLDRPPDLLIVNDAWGLSLALGLALKEIPFLFLMTLAALPQADAQRAFALARTLGYRRMAAFAKAVMPRLYPQLRLPLLAVLAYGLSVVDMALVLGPTSPPTLAVETLRLTQDPDLARHFEAGAAAVLQLALVLVGVGLWLVGERLLGVVWRLWAASGGRHCAEAGASIAAPCLAFALATLVGLAFTSLVLWSFAASWRFPAVLPAAFSLDIWRHELAYAWPIIGRTAGAGAFAVTLALVLTILCLENEARRGVPPPRLLALLYVPLLVPQIAFLSGVASLMIALRLDSGFLGVGLAHCVFVLPYVFLSLSGPWRALDPRYRSTALLLRAGAWRALVAVRLPLMLRAVLATAALGFAISISQYLATLIIGGGRFSTVTTEAVALAAGGDRRLVGVHALLQAALPLIAYALALSLPALLFRHRKGLQHG